MRNGKPHYWDAVHVTSELIGRNSLQSIWTLMNKEMDSEESSYKRSSGQVSLCRQVRQSRDHFKVGISSHFTFGPNTISQEKRIQQRIVSESRKSFDCFGNWGKKTGKLFLPFSGEKYLRQILFLSFARFQQKGKRPTTAIGEARRCEYMARLWATV